MRFPSFARTHMGLLAGSVLTSLMILAPHMAISANVEGGETVTITTAQAGDTYLAGGEVRIQAPIAGDLIVAGGEISVRDTVRQDLLVGGGEIDITGYVGDDIRMAGGEIVLSGTVAGDVVVAGGVLTIREGAVIGGDLILSGGELEVDGTVRGHISGFGGELLFSGVAEQTLRFQGGEITIDGEIFGESTLQAQKIFLTDNATFHGDVTYWQEPGEMDFGSALQGATAVFDPDLAFEEDWDGKDYLGMSRLAFLLMRVASAALLILLLVWGFNRYFGRAGQTILEQPLRSLGIGTLYLITVPAISVVLMATVIGLPIGLFVMSTYAFSLVFAQAIAMLVLTHAYSHYTHRDWTKGMVLLVAVVGFAALRVLNWIPILGMVITLIAVAVAFGALLAPLFQRNDRPEPGEAPFEDPFEDGEA